MVERGTLNADVAGSNPASPASFDADAVLQAVLDYNMARVEHKMLVLGISFQDALTARMAEMVKEASE
jgi:hypothetical protein